MKFCCSELYRWKYTWASRERKRQFDILFRHARISPILRAAIGREEGWRTGSRDLEGLGRIGLRLLRRRIPPPRFSCYPVKTFAFGACSSRILSDSFPEDPDLLVILSDDSIQEGKTTGSRDRAGSPCIKVLGVEFPRRRRDIVDEDQILRHASDCVFELKFSKPAGWNGLASLHGAQEIACD